MISRQQLRLFSWVLFVAGLVALYFAGRSSWREAAHEIASADRTLLFVAFATLAAGRGIFALAAWVTAAKVLGQAHARHAAVAWMRSAVGKYIPGALWQPASALGYLKQGGASTTSAATIVLFDMSTSVVAGVIVGIAALPGLIVEDSGTIWWLLLAVPMFAAMHPRVFRYGLQLAQRLTGRQGQPPPDVPTRLVVLNVLLHMAGWILAGVSLGLLFKALGSPVDWPTVIPAASISWALGFLVLVAPAGLGVREIVLVLLLKGTAPQESIIAAAVLSRLTFIGVDMAGAAASLLISTKGDRVV